MIALAHAVLMALAVVPHVPLHGDEHRAVARAALRVYARDAREVQEMERLAQVESGWRPAAVSDKGACGLWQVRPSVWGTTCEALRTRPLHSVALALTVKRRMEARCGRAWKVCYQYGPSHPRALRSVKGVVHHGNQRR